MLQVRLTPGERAKAEADAAGQGLSLSGHARALLMGDVTPRTPPRPTHDAAELARLLGQLGKVGSNLNQLAKLANQRQIVPPPALDACLAEVRDLRRQLAETLNGDC